MKNFIVALFLLLVVAVAALAAFGLLRVRSTENQIDFTIDKAELKQKVQSTADEVKQTGRDALEKTNEALDDALGGKETPHGAPASSAPASPAPAEPAPAESRPATDGHSTTICACFA